MKKLMLLIIIQIFFLQFAKSCSCVMGATIGLSEYVNTDVIFTGKATKVTMKTNFKIVEFEITKITSVR